jgi:hypothetical protein
VQISCTQGGKPKKFILQGVSHKKGKKQNLPILHGRKDLFTLKLITYLINLKCYG